MISLKGFDRKRVPWLLVGGPPSLTTGGCPDLPHLPKGSGVIFWDSRDPFPQRMLFSPLQFAPKFSFFFGPKVPKMTFWVDFGGKLFSGPLHSGSKILRFGHITAGVVHPPPRLEGG